MDELKLKAGKALEPDWEWIERTTSHEVGTIGGIPAICQALLYLKEKIDGGNLEITEPPPVDDVMTRISGSDVPDEQKSKEKDHV